MASGYSFGLFWTEQHVEQHIERSKTPTIYDVARVSGVSISTVSRVLNTPEKVNISTRKKVIDAVTVLGFVPKAEAIVHARKNVGGVGVLVPFFTAPSFVQRTRGVASALAGTEFELIVYTVDSTARLEAYLDVLPMRHRLDGLIIMSMPISGRQAEHIRTHRLETVLIEVKHSSFCSVDFDNFEGGRMAARYLISRGYKRCAFVGESGVPDYKIFQSDIRLEGFRQQLNESGVELPDHYVSREPYSRENAMRQAETLLELDPPPDAIFAYSDLHAADMLASARRHGLSIPDDLAIIGFDGTDIADYLGLTTVDQGLDESGRLAAELLMSRISDHPRPPQNIRLQPKIMERQTT